MIKIDDPAGDAGMEGVQERFRDDTPARKRTARGECERYYRDVVLAYDGDECLIWPFSPDSNGYAAMGSRKGTRMVSRMVCEFVNGPPPTPRHHAAHSCGKGHLRCVTKRHMSWKTPSENQADRLVHGTHDRGERCSQAKLTEANVRAILALNGKMPHRKIAERFNVGRATVTSILSRKNWGWLNV